MKPILLVLIFVFFLNSNFAQESNISNPGLTSNKLYPIRKNYQYGFINLRGEVVIPLKFALASRFSEGLAAVGFCNEESPDRICGE